MNPHQKFKNYSSDNYGYLLLIITTMIFILVVGFVINPVHKKKIKSYNEKYKHHLITCPQCKGSGEYPTDINKLMMEASLSSFINHHLMIDKCEECVRLKSGDGYAYCDIVNNKYAILLREYASVGPRVEMGVCDKCIGMGQFTCQKEDGSFMTQKEYEENKIK